MGIHYSQS